MRVKTSTKRRHVVSRSQGLKASPLYRWNPRVASRTLDGTAFILLNSRMRRLNEVGSLIWDRCERGATLAQLVRVIVDEFETTAVRARADAQAFVQELVAQEMLISVSARSQSGRSL